jgi:AraC-like DNA-binding protein
MVGCKPPDIKHTRRIVPCGLFELIFYLNTKPVSTGNSRFVTDNVFISGQQSAFFDIEVPGNLSLFAIYFYPHGLSFFLDLPLNELHNQSIPLRYVLKENMNRLEDELSEVESFEKRISIAERFLTAQIHQNETRYQYKRIRHTVYLINRSKGIIDIEDLAAASCYGRKQYERNFSDIIGTTPKQFLKIVRFQDVIYRKTKHPDLSLTQLAYECGYYDQAHMINNFKALSGYTPKQFFEDCEPFSDYFE